MLMVISPAKTLDYESPLATEKYTQPELLAASQQLIDIARQLSPAQIASLMSISDKLAHLNAERFNDWQADFTPTMPARQFWPSKAMCIPGWMPGRWKKTISHLHSNTCGCFPGYTACYDRST